MPRDASARDTRQWRHRALFAGLLAGLLAGVLVSSCADRPLEDEEPPPDIEGLCYEHCARVMECLWYPGANADFSTEEGCRESCGSQLSWERCPRALEAFYACYAQYDCPEYAELGTDYPEGPCSEQMLARTNCTPERDAR